MMKNNIHSVIATALMVAAFGSTWPAVSEAADVDFSCMVKTVKGKPQLVARYREYDVEIRNTCPGPAYWKMCIERIDPFTQEILETHTPSGLIEIDSRARVNLHLRRGSEDDRFRNRFQEFYVTVGYAIKGSASAVCSAAGCEARMRDLRSEIRSNEAAWAKAVESLQARLESECPDSGWNAQDQDDCRARVQEASAEALAGHARQDEELRARMASVDPLLCKLYGGDLLAE
jgi:hypothetical protein